MAVDGGFSLTVSDFHAGAASNDPQARLDAARKAWAAGGLRDYDFRLQVGCFCPSQVIAPHTLRVRAGKAINANRYNRAYSTVPKLFKRIQKALATHAAQVTVKYAPSGLPRSIYIDQDRNIADEELSLSATRLREA